MKRLFCFVGPNRSAPHTLFKLEGIIRKKLSDTNNICKIELVIKMN